MDRSEELTSQILQLQNLPDNIIDILTERDERFDLIYFTVLTRNENDAKTFLNLYIKFKQIFIEIISTPAAEMISTRTENLKRIEQTLLDLVTDIQFNSPLLTKEMFFDGGDRLNNISLPVRLVYLIPSTPVMIKQVRLQYHRPIISESFQSNDIIELKTTKEVKKLIVDAITAIPLHMEKKLILVTVFLHISNLLLGVPPVNDREKKKDFVMNVIKLFLHKNPEKLFINRYNLLLQETANDFLKIWSRIDDLKIEQLISSLSKKLNDPLFFLFIRKVAMICIYGKFYFRGGIKDGDKKTKILQRLKRNPKSEFLQPYVLEDFDVIANIARHEESEDYTTFGVQIRLLHQYFTELHNFISDEIEEARKTNTLEEIPISENDVTEMETYSKRLKQKIDSGELEKFAFLLKDWVKAKSPSPALIEKYTDRTQFITRRQLYNTLKIEVSAKGNFRDYIAKLKTITKTNAFFEQLLKVHLACQELTDNPPDIVEDNDDTGGSIGTVDENVESLDMDPLTWQSP